MKMSLAEGLSLFLAVDYDPDAGQFTITVSSAYGGRDSVIVQSERAGLKAAIRQAVNSFVGAWLTDIATLRGF
jgi:hypothetical protein